MYHWPVQMIHRLSFQFSLLFTVICSINLDSISSFVPYHTQQMAVPMSECQLQCSPNKCQVSVPVKQYSNALKHSSSTASTTVFGLLIVLWLLSDDRRLMTVVWCLPSDGCRLMSVVWWQSAYYREYTSFVLTCSNSLLWISVRILTPCKLIILIIAPTTLFMLQCQPWRSCIPLIRPVHDNRCRMISWLCLSVSCSESVELFQTCASSLLHSVMYRVGQNRIYIYGVHTVFLAGKSPNIRSYTVFIYGSDQT